MRFFPIPSFIRQADKTRKELESAVNFVAKFDPGKLKQGETGLHSFSFLRSFSRKVAAIAQYRSIISFAAIADGERALDASTLSSRELGAYNNVWQAIERYYDHQDAGIAYQHLLETMTELMDFSFDALDYPESATLLPLTLQTRDWTEEGFNVTRKAFAELDFKDNLQSKDRYRLQLRRFFEGFSLDTHMGAELYEAIKRHYKDPLEARLAWLTIYAKIFQWVEELPTFANSLAQAGEKDEPLRINFHAVVEYVRINGPRELLKINGMGVRFSAGEYLVYLPFRPFEGH